MRHNAFILIAAAGLICAACGEQSASKRSEITVKVLEGGQQHGSAQLCYVGAVEASRQVVLNSPAPATIEKIMVRKGARVKKGQTIMELSSTSVQSAFNVASANLEYAQDAIRRAEEVHGAGAITDSKMVEIRSQVEKARASYDAAKAAVEDLTVKAPYDGTIGQLPVSEGEQVTIGARLADFVDANAVEIRFSVPENEYAWIKPGDRVEIEVPAVGVRSAATVSVKGIQANRLAHSYECVINSISDATGMVPGMVCKVYVPKPGTEGLVIPASAVMTDSEGRFVWVVCDGVVDKKHVTIDGYSEKGVVVLDGLDKNDSVIVEGSRKVSTGMKVKTVH